MPRSPPSVTSGKFIAPALAAFGVAIGGVVLLGWGFDVAVLKSVVSGLVTMKPNTAACFVFAGISLWLQSVHRIGHHVIAKSKGFAQLLALLVTTVGLLTLAEYLLQWNLGFDGWLFNESVNAEQTAFPGRMSPATAFCFTLLGLALTFLDAESARGHRPAEFFSLATLLVGCIALLGYLYGAPALYRIFAYTSMAVHTALLMVALGCGVLAGRANQGLTAIITGADLGGVMARAAMPLVIFIPVILGWLRLKGQQAGWYDMEFGLALYATSTVVMLVTAVWVGARGLGQADKERAQAQKASRESAARLAGIIDSAMDAIITIDSQQRIVLFNPAAEVVFRRTADQVMGKTVEQFIPDRFRAAHAEHIRHFAESGAASRTMSVTRSVSGLRSNGEEFPIEASISQVGHNGDKLFTVILRDVTERHATEARLRQTQKMEALGTLAAGIAHDFNNILGAIVGNAKLALSDLAIDHPLHDRLEQINQAAHRASDLVGQILTFGRQQTLARRVVHLQSVVEEALKLLRITTPETIEFHVQLNDKTPNVSADPTQIHQVIMNLGANAVYAMRERGGTLEILLTPVTIDQDHASTIPDLHAGRYAELSIRDTGSGIDKATLARIFEPFFTTKEVGRGTGLGLSIVHGIMKSHEGAISVYSEPGRGTIFVLYFPAAEETVTGILSPPSRGVRGEGKHVLLVDDDSLMLTVATQMLKRAGYEVVGHSDPQRALKIFRASPHAFDLVMTDRSMPALSGPDLVERVLLIRPDIPVVMTTGYIADDDKRAAQTIGVRELILKPYSPEVLVAAVDRAIQDHRAQIAKKGTATRSPAIQAIATTGESNEIFDKGALIARLNGMEPIQKEMIRFFHEDCPKLTESIHKAVQFRDAKELHFVAHRLHGIFGTLCARRAEKAALKLELMGRSGNLTDVNAAMCELEVELEALGLALKDWEDSFQHKVPGN